ncbi:hypothetical protein NDU88_000171 [Pleurodeles waltl]|uniref:Uncharacterized protein n=1 Tax=Pleurodeles waltl TaxID=8319 RepID=A0AAV7TE51_PLEWA|nr:hypothetical protein NDU88_000171 [Pleurodeles waltl]
MAGYRVLQSVLLLLSLHWLPGGLAYPTDCKNEPGTYLYCSAIPLHKLLDRVIQHADLLYRMSEQSCAIFEERIVPPGLRFQKYHTSCYNKDLTMSIPNSKHEVQKLSDKWLLHAVLLMVQSWVEPFLYLQTSLSHYDDIPGDLLDKIKSLSEKLPSFEQGVGVLIKKMADGAPFTAELEQPPNHLSFGLRTVNSAQQNYMVLDCFRKDAHKIETFLKLLRCRWMGTPGCYQPEAALSISDSLLA